MDITIAIKTDAPYGYRWASTINNDVGPWVASYDRKLILERAVKSFKECKANPFMANTMKIEVRGL